MTRKRVHFRTRFESSSELGREGRGSGKAVVFTESITTQEYLRRLLLDIGLSDEDVTLFRGTNDQRAGQTGVRTLD